MTRAVSNVSHIPGARSRDTRLFISVEKTANPREIQNIVTRANNISASFQSLIVKYNKRHVITRIGEISDSSCSLSNDFYDSVLYDDRSEKSKYFLRSSLVLHNYQTIYMYIN